MQSYFQLTLRAKQKTALQTALRLLMASKWFRAFLYLLSSSFSALKLRTVRIPPIVCDARSLFWAWQSWILSLNSCLTNKTTRNVNNDGLHPSTINFTKPYVLFSDCCFFVVFFSIKVQGQSHHAPTLDKALYLFCSMAKRGISMQVSTVSSQDRRSITTSMRPVFTELRTAALAFSATVRPILSTSECRLEERRPCRWNRQDRFKRKWII